MGEASSATTTSFVSGAPTSAMSTYCANIGGLAERLDLDCFHGCSLRGRTDCLDLGRRGPFRSPRFWQTRFSPVGDRANYGSEFFAFVGQGVGEARRVPLVKRRLNQATTLQ